LHVYDEVEVVEQHPALLAVALAVYGLRIMSSQRLLDPIDNRADLALVGRGDHQEHVGNGQLFGNVVRDQIGAQLVNGRVRGRARQLQCAFSGGQDLSICRRSLVMRSGQRATKGSPLELIDRPQLCEMSRANSC
jgi:hypothetical protein